MSNIITSVGVLLILVAYFANTTGKLTQNKIYFGLNATGSLFAGYGAFLVQLWPIVVLETIWALVSLYEILIINRNK
jgi:CHASE2 domain-containing sensor protein